MTENEKLFMKECDCPEILKLWKQKKGDEYILRVRDELYDLIEKQTVFEVEGNTLCLARISSFPFHLKEEKEDCIWLPSLSQIIVMIEKRHSGKWDIHRVIEEKNTDYLMKIWSGDYVNFFTEGATPDLCAIIALKQVIKGER